MDRASDGLTAPTPPMGAILAASIQPKKSTAEVLHFTEERFRNAFESTVVGMGLLGLNGRFLEVNAAWCRMNGYSREEFLDRDLPAIVHPEDLAAATQDFHRLAQGTVPSFGRRISISTEGRQPRVGPHQRYRS